MDFDLTNILEILVKIFTLILPLILAVAYLTYAERKIIAAVQLRLGPTEVGFMGTLQPIADALKLMFKEVIIPKHSRSILFLLAPVITFALALIGWAVIPFGVEILPDGSVLPKVIANIDVGILYIYAITSLEVYGVIISGWASNSNYAFLGAIRSASQMISYEVSIGLILVSVLIFGGSLNLAELVMNKHQMPFWVDIFFLPMSIVFFISILAETNRHPFDLPEAEAELVAGYNVEYSSIPFSLFFLGEYANMILTSAIMVILFMGGWYPPIEGIALFDKIPGMVWFIAKIILVLFMFILVRAAFPRYRYDQLMRLGWKFFLPISFAWVIISSVVFKVVYL